MALDDNSLTTLARTKDYLGVTNDSNDTLLERLIDAASSFIETYCDRTFKLTSYILQQEGSGTDTLILRNYPVIGGVVLDENQSGDSTQDYNTIESKNYWVFNTDGYLQFLNSETVFIATPEQYQVTYEGGYRVQGATVTGQHIALPLDLELATWKLVSSIFNTRNTDGISSQTLGNYSVTFIQAMEMDNELRMTLDNYKHPNV
jgi:hypothetical protein|tara:strand:- start:1593 stop:2204 length:612 start_codon:yes stop_codon:yes gene_type:complete